MNHRIVFCCVLIAVGLTGCSTQRAKEEIKPQGPAVSGAASSSATNASKTNEELATTSAANVNRDLSGLALKAEQDAAAEKARLMTASAEAGLSQRVTHFDFDKSDIQPGDITMLKAHAAYLVDHPRAHVRLTGHTDERGTAEYNMALGERRAKAVESFLEFQGVKAQQLDVVSFGLEKPVDPGHSEAAWAKNRRVELNYQNEAP